jgi:hypothetical protein
MPFLGIGAVDLIGFLVALAAILAVGALWVFFQPLVKLFNIVRINFLFIHTQGLGDAISNGLELAMQSIIVAYSELARDSAHFLWVLGVGVWHAVYHFVTGITQALGLAKQANTTANSTAAALPNEISGAISSSNSYADGVLAVAQGDVITQFNEATAHTDTLYNDSIAHADTLYGEATANADTLYNDAIAHADDLYNQGIGVAQSLATAAALDGINQADNVYNDLVGQIGSVQDVLNSEIDKILPEAESFANDAAAAAAALSVAGLLTRVGTLEAETTECLEPLCDEVTPNASQLGEAGRLLKTVEGLFTAAALMGLLVAGVEDPKGTAGTLQTTMGWVAPLSLSLADVVGSAAGVQF